ncbi:MAG: hypothetical protein KKA05_07235 [Alphaproteobacteria bacterium]|nr:hypothetical protein [Alphaproteobacteria bacterium]
MMSVLDENRQKPSADEWQNAVGATVAIARALTEDKDLMARAPDIAKAFDMAAKNMLIPYVALQREVVATATAAHNMPGEERGARLATVFNNHLPRVGGAALLASEVARDLAHGLPEREGFKLKSLAAVLDRLVCMEVNGVQREAKSNEFVQRAQMMVPTYPQRKVG